MVVLVVIILIYLLLLLFIQVRRLKHHPSIIVWAGNNENEKALRDNWYFYFSIKIIKLILLFL